MDVTTELHGDVALVTMDDGKKNAVTPDALIALNAALHIAEQNAAAVVLAGRPGSFCAGFDLSVMTGDDPDAIRAIGVGGGELALRLWSFPKPLVAACTGHAFTIGAIWLCACDTRIGEQGPYKFGMTETKMGMTLTPWALEPLSHRITPQQWIPSIVQSRIYDPGGALDAGFLDEVVPEGGAVDRAIEVATELAALPGRAYAGNKLSSRRTSIETARADLDRLRPHPDDSEAP